MYLFINTADPQILFLVLLDRKGEILIKKEIKAKYQQSERLLSEIGKLVSEYPVSKYKSVKVLKGIIVVTGPGSFSGLRIGLATANSIAWALQIPIVGLRFYNSVQCPVSKCQESMQKIIKKGFTLIKNRKKFNKPIMPFYGKKPNINLKNTKNN